MGLNTYSGLKTAVALWLARPGDPLVVPSIPDMITLFESHANRVLRTSGNSAKATLNYSGGDNTQDVPTDYLEMRAVQLQTDPRAELVYLTPAQLDAMAIPDQSGAPVYYTIDTGATGLRVRVGPTPDTTYTLELQYYSSLPSLGGGLSLTNWLLLTSPDAYLFGALAEAEAFIGHDERVAMWLQRRDTILASINDVGRRALGGSPALQIKTDTGNP